MAINVDPSGAYDRTNNKNTSTQTYDYFSGELTTTDAFTGNDLDFGAPLSEIHLVNRHATNAVAFQWEDLFGTNKASGIVLPNSVLTFRKALKGKMRLRSLVNGAQSNSMFVFGL